MGTARCCTDNARLTAETKAFSPGRVEVSDNFKGTLRYFCWISGGNRFIPSVAGVNVS
ncbi:hypothetical protein JWG39_02190 [Desulforhopalus vacuolatus]|uniref:hypothetical protein n=1 Tax=Desulforhopalus vacuolatus TaxID=40414 RepID=UPI0019642FEB|nr:hypothetical protein [Desulforhopalus vacuolatus]MBM9518626.1 hypothetical protein [Desulforhopalus vacuolatus]